MSQTEWCLTPGELSGGQGCFFQDDQSWSCCQLSKTKTRLTLEILERIGRQRVVRQRLKRICLTWYGMICFFFNIIIIIIIVIIIIVIVIIIIIIFQGGGMEVIMENIIISPCLSTLKKIKKKKRGEKKKGKVLGR